MKVNGRIYLPVTLLCSLALLPGYCNADACTPFPSTRHCYREYNCVYGCQENRRKILNSDTVYACNDATTKYVVSVVNILGSKCADIEISEKYNNNNFNLTSCHASTSAFASCGNRSPYKLSIVVGYNIWLIFWVCLFGIVYLIPIQEKAQDPVIQKQESTLSAPKSIVDSQQLTSRFTNADFKL